MTTFTSCYQADTDYFTPKHLSDITGNYELVNSYNIKFCSTELYPIHIDVIADSITFTTFRVIHNIDFFDRGDTATEIIRTCSSYKIELGNVDTLYINGEPGRVFYNKEDSVWTWYQKYEIEKMFMFKERVSDEVSECLFYNPNNKHEVL